MLDRGAVREVRSVARLRILKATSYKPYNVRRRYLTYRWLLRCQPAHCKSGVHAGSKLFRKRSFAVDPHLSITDIESSAPLVQLLSSPCGISLVVLKKPNTDTTQVSQRMVPRLEGGNQSKYSKQSDASRSSSLLQEKGDM